ncbi:MAG: serine/threonine-protein kinase [Anaerolineales bacterium]|jgi:serine/threonine-protein kinase|nr:serine/threonine-protein kinase [Anaerolineales bacterium]
MSPQPFVVLIPKKQLFIQQPGPSERDKALIGKTFIGKYRIKSIIGSGGMGTVFRAEHIQLKRDFAIKVLSDSLAVIPENVAFFHEEARKLARLTHPNIVAISDVDTDAATGVPFFVMELLEGQPLDKVLSTEGNLPLSRVILIIQQMAAALNYAHDKELIHRDIKPANIFITKDGRAILTDFGIAIFNEEASKIKGTAGTIAYMSPEQREGKQVDPSTDIFSLGVVCYEMLTGTSYYLARRAGYNPLQRIAPLEIRNVLDKALANSPVNRYGNAIEFADELSKSAKLIEQRKIFKNRASLAFRLCASIFIGFFVVRWAVLSIVDSVWPAPDSSILYYMDGSDGLGDIWVMNLDGSNPRRLTNDQVDNLKPVWDVNRGAVAFTSVAKDGIFIRYIEYHSGNPQVLFSNCDDIDYGPNGEIAVSKWNEEGNNWDVAVFQKGELVTVIATENDDFRPDWSPDGQKLAYLSIIDGNFQIFIVDISSKTEPIQITFDGQNYGPEWSPDGNLIAFSSSRLGHYDIFVMNADGSDQRILFQHDGDDFSPSWSPDGEKIVFTSSSSGNLDLVIYDLNNSQLRQLTHTPGNEEMPFWGR